VLLPAAHSDARPVFAQHGCKFCFPRQADPPYVVLLALLRMIFAQKPFGVVKTSALSNSQSVRSEGLTPAVLYTLWIWIYYKTHTSSQGSQRNNPLSQQVSLSRSRSGHAQWKRTNRATQTRHIPLNISPGVQHRRTQGRHKLGYKVVCGHMQPRTEMRPTRPSEPADTAAIQQEVAPAQHYANLSQGARYKGRPRNPSRP
jgi:hypothetical protein